MDECSDDDVKRKPMIELSNATPVIEHHKKKKVHWQVLLLLLITRKMWNIEGAKPDHAIVLHMLSDIIICDRIASKAKIRGDHPGKQASTISY